MSDHKLDPGDLAMFLYGVLLVVLILFFGGEPDLKDGLVWWMTGGKLGG